MVVWVQVLVVAAVVVLASTVLGSVVWSVGSGSAALGEEVWIGRRTASSNAQSPCRPLPVCDVVPSLPAPSVFFLARGIAVSGALLLARAFYGLSSRLRLFAFARAPQPRLVPSIEPSLLQFPIVLEDPNAVLVALAGYVVGV